MWPRELFLTTLMIVGHISTPSRQYRKCLVLSVCVCLLQLRPFHRVYTPSFPTTYKLEKTYHIQVRKKQVASFVVTPTSMNGTHSPTAPPFSSRWYCSCASLSMRFTKTQKWMQSIEKIISANKRPVRQNNLQQQYGHKLTGQTHYYSSAGPTPFE